VPPGAEVEEVRGLQQRHAVPARELPQLAAPSHAAAAMLAAALPRCRAVAPSHVAAAMLAAALSHVAAPPRRCSNTAPSRTVATAPATEITAASTGHRVHRAPNRSSEPGRPFGGRLTREGLSATAVG
jgi:hypothetical protein